LLASNLNHRRSACLGKGDNDKVIRRGNWVDTDTLAPTRENIYRRCW